MKTIIIPTDFSANARNAARYAVSLCSKGDHIILANAYDLLVSNPEVIVSVYEMMEQDSKAGLQKEKIYLASLPGAEGLIIETAPLKGETVSELNKLAQKVSADYIIMGTHGASGIKEALIGSVAASVLKKVSCPVIAIPSEADIVTPKNISLATDYRKLKSLEELGPLKEIASLHSSTITIINVLEPGGLPEADQAVEGLKLNAYFQPVKLEYNFIESTNIEEGIIEYLHKNDCDLLAVVERKLGFFEKLFHTSIAKKLAYHTKTPLLILHDPRE